MDELKAMIQKMDTKMNQMNKILTLHARILYFKIRQVDIKIRSTEENIDMMKEILRHTRNPIKKL